MQIVRNFIAFISVVALGGLALTPVSHATTVIPPTFNQLVGESGYVVRAVVTDLSAEWQQNGANRHIITQATFETREVIAGTPPDPLVISMLGGKVGDTEMRVDGAPRFKVGDEYILFVRGTQFKLIPFVAMSYGQYVVQQDVKTGTPYVARSNGQPLFSTDDVARPLDAVPTAMASGTQPLTPAAFAASIRSAFSATHQPKQKMER